MALSNFWQIILERYRELEKRINQIALRERLLLFACLLLAIYVIWFFGLSMPLKKNIASLLTKEKVLTQQIPLLKQQIQMFADKKRPSIPEEEQIKALNKQLNQLEDYLISAKKMVALLRMTISKERGLVLQELNNLPDKPLISLNNISVPENLQLYAQGIRFVFTGDYENTVKYLKELEQLKWPLFWDNLHYEALTYPMAKITLELHTFSREKEN